MEHRFDIWRNDTSTSVLDEKHKKNGISIFIVTSDHDMSSLLRKFRGSKDMPQRSRQKHGTYAMAQDSTDAKPNPSVDNLQLPTNGEHFEDGNHQKQVSMLYRNICLKKKQQNLRSRMIASLAFRKLCRFVSSFAGNRKLRRAGNNGFVFILRFLRRFEKIKIRCEAQILCLSYLPTAAKSKC